MGAEQSNKNRYITTMTSGFTEDEGWGNSLCFDFSDVDSVEVNCIHFSL